MNFTADFLFALVMTSVLLCVDLFVVFAAAYDAGEGQKSTADIAADAEFFSEPAAEDGTAADQTVLQMKPAVAVPAGTTAQQLLRMGCVGVDEGSENSCSCVNNKCEAKKKGVQCGINSFRKCYKVNLKSRVETSGANEDEPVSGDAEASVM